MIAEIQGIALLSTIRFYLPTIDLRNSPALREDSSGFISLLVAVPILDLRIV
jgi:hypothetical protein